MRHAGTLVLAGLLVACADKPIKEPVALARPPMDSPYQGVYPTDLSVARVEGTWVGAVHLAGSPSAHAVVVQSSSANGESDDGYFVAGDSGSQPTGLPAQWVSSQDILHSSESCSSSCQIIGEVFFELNSAELSVTAKSRLDQVAGSKKPLEIVGFADAVGESVHNQSLALARANAMASYLKEKGLDRLNVSAGLVSQFEGEQFRKGIIVGL